MSHPLVSWWIATLFISRGARAVVLSDSTQAPDSDFLLIREPLSKREKERSSQKQKQKKEKSGKVRVLV